MKEYFIIVDNTKFQQDEENLIFFPYIGPVLDNDLQNPLPSKRADHKIFLAYVSDPYIFIGKNDPLFILQVERPYSLFKLYIPYSLGGRLIHYSEDEFTRREGTRFRIFFILNIDLTPNQSEKCNGDPHLVLFNKIQKIFLCFSCFVSP